MPTASVIAVPINTYHGHATRASAAEHCPTNERRARSDRRASSKLGGARYQPGCDAGTKNTESEQSQRRQGQGHCIFEARFLTGESAGKLSKKSRTDADNDGKHHHLYSR